MNAIEKIKKGYKIKDNDTLDQQLSDILLNKTLGEIALLGEEAKNMRVNFICTLIYNAIFGDVVNVISEKRTIINPDINLINEIIKRVDGAVPNAEDRDLYANIIGDRINEIMNKPPSYASQIGITDLGIDALAKAILLISMNTNTKTNVTKRRERQTATDILLSRVGGRKNTPEQNRLEVKYVEPEWSRGLPNEKK